MLVLHLQHHFQLGHAVAPFIGQIHRERVELDEHRFCRGLVQGQLFGIGVLRRLQEEPARTAAACQYHGQNADQQTLATFLFAVVGLVFRLA
jgi:hypothetical protein